MQQTLRIFFKQNDLQAEFAQTKQREALFVKIATCIQLAIGSKRHALRGVRTRPWWRFFTTMALSASGGSGTTTGCTLRQGREKFSQPAV